MRIRKRRMLKRLEAIGSQVNVVYQIRVNNADMIAFDSEDAVYKYLSDYRDNNVIFSLEMYRIEIYSL